MSDLLQWIASNDLGARARTLLDFVDGADPCFLGLVVAVLVFLGSRMVAGQPDVRGWGLRLGAAAFLLYGGYTWLVEPNGPRPPGTVALRAACVAGCVLAVSWIVLPVLAFVHSHLRLALTVFLGYGAWALVADAEYAPDRLPAIGLKALLAAGLALVVAWILEPVWGFVKPFLPRRPEHPAPPDREEPSAQSPPRRIVVLAPPSSSPAEAEVAVLRERDAQRRREKARLQLELAYVQALPAVGTWFPRKTFDDFVQRHLADPLPPEDVEENARQLQAVLRQHQDQSQGPAQFDSLEELGHWLLDEQQRIQALPLEQPLRQSRLLDLHQRYLLLAARTVQKQTALPC